MLSRTIALRRVPGVFMTPARLYTDSRKEGSVAQHKGFSAKEKAHEDQYVHQQEAAQLTKLKKLLEDNKKKVEDLQAEHDALAKKTGQE